MQREVLEKYIAEWLEDYSKEAGLSHQTVLNKTSSMKRFLLFVGDRKVTVPIIREYLSWLRERLMLSSVRCEIKNLRALSCFLVKRRYIKQEDDWSDQISMPKYIKQPLQVPDQITMERIIIEGTTPQKGENNRCQKAKSETKDALMFCLRHGLRSEELRSLETSQVSLDSDTPTFSFKRKGGKVMTLPITKDMVPMLKERCSAPRRLIFTVSEKTLNTALQRGAERLHITEPVHCHTLRHCFATELLRKGVPIEQVSAMLGHSNIQLTYSYYQHLLPNDFSLHMAKQTIVRERMPTATIFETVIKAVESTGVTKDARFQHLIKQEGKTLVIQISV